MARELDLANWPRRATFEHFQTFDQPYFSVCTRLDVSRLVALKSQLPGGLSLAYHHVVLRACQEVEAFRLRIQDGRVWVHERVHGSMTVLRADDSIAFASLHWHERLSDFVADAEPRMRASQRGERPFDDQPDPTALVHFTTLPWFDFSSFSHARHLATRDATPKFAFGALCHDGGRSSLAFAIDVHHALVDGLHVGRLVQCARAWLDRPQDWVGR